MKRRAFVMKLNPGCRQEYEKRHDEIWPELESELAYAGISDYSIFLDESSDTLFATLKLTDENSIDSLPEKAIMKKWWAFMADIMETNPDNSPVEQALVEVFHMD